MEETRDNRKVIVSFLAVLIIAVIVVAAVAASPKKKPGGSSSTVGSAGSNGGNSSAAPTARDSSNTRFADGSYTATGSYESPGGNESITVHVTLQNGVITASSADSGAQDPEASEYQSMFISGYKSQVVGKKITDVSLSRVSGSSLTSQGFNEAINQIENQAKA